MGMATTDDSKEAWSPELWPSMMLQEACEAPERVQHALSMDDDLYRSLAAKLQALSPSLVATIARGSSDHAANYASYLIPLCLGIPVASLPPSLISILAAPMSLRGQFVLALSQSGSSPDIVRSLASMKASGALTAAIVNEAASELAKVADVFCAQNAGPEKSVAATKTVLCTLTAIARIAANWAKDEKLLSHLALLPQYLRSSVSSGLAADVSWLQGVSNAYVISRGLGMTAALETALKLKETAGIHAEAFSSAEVRHGPREVVDRNYVVIAFAIPGSDFDGVLETARELKNQGARVILIAPPEARAITPEIVLPKCDDNRLMPILALQAVYPWLARSSRAAGRHPDHPKTLKSKVILTV